jgi:hypothetical protein
MICSFELLRNAPDDGYVGVVAAQGAAWPADHGIVDVQHSDT